MDAAAADERAMPSREAAGQDKQPAKPKHAMHDNKNRIMRVPAIEVDACGYLALA